MPQVLEALHNASERLQALTRLPLPATEVTHLHQLHDLVRLLSESHGLDLSCAFAADAGTRLKAARRASELIEAYRELQQGLSLPYAEEACQRIPFQALRTAWQEAEGKFWFFATLAKKKIARQLASLGGATGIADFPSDLAALERQHTLSLELHSLAPVLQSMPGWQGLASDLKQMLQAANLAERLRSTLNGLAESPEHLIALRGAAARLVIEANDMLAPGGQIDAALISVQQALAGYAQSAGRFVDLAAEGSTTPMTVATLSAACAAIQQQEQQLKAWCDWCRAREQASAAGLSPFGPGTGARPPGAGGGRADVRHGLCPLVRHPGH